MDEAVAGDDVIAWNGVPRRMSYVLIDERYFYFGGPMSLVNAACAEHANVLMDYSECTFSCMFDKVIRKGEELVACYSEDGSALETGVTRLCEVHGCRILVSK